ncbi:type II toxin-antitoxin system PemK/MazF family toxin [Castellaniella caeni]|uniref:type II toxin-antitoxin system PemK/MazF family toxin n=1 Tax=Castellaniella caeni TaxID=266123 RepID=UPI00082D980C|nr:type II toxin-antitoxin system PemK/MazF family toxin [Castellaniella caeni]
MQRGDLVVVSLPGAYGKPRPALVIQSNLLAELNSVIICPVTSELRNAAFRVTIDPDASNGLQVRSQVMVDKISTLPRARTGPIFGHLDHEAIRAIERALLVVTGIA